MTTDEQVQATASLFNTVAERYDANRFFPISAAHLVRHAELDGCERMLDLSTGTGNVALAAAAATGGNLAIDAVDISEKMLEQARIKCREHGVNCVQFARMDAHDLQFEPESFDRITCGYGLFFYPEMERVARHLMQLLKPRGKFIFSSFTEDAFMPQSRYFFDRLERYGVEVNVPSGNLLDTEENIRTLCEGHPECHYEIHTEAIRYPITPEQWWANLESAGYRKFLAALGDDLPAFKEEHLKELNALIGENGLELVSDSFYTIMTKR